MPISPDLKNLLTTQKNLIEDIIDFQKMLTSGINKNAAYIAKRFDDVDKRFDIIEKRLDRLEGNVKTVSSNTDILPNMFEMLESDGHGIARLNLRVNDIENKVGNN